MYAYINFMTTYGCYKTRKIINVQRLIKLSRYAYPIKKSNTQT